MFYQVKDDKVLYQTERKSKIIIKQARGRVGVLGPLKGPIQPPKGGVRAYEGPKIQPFQIIQIIK